MSKMKQYIDLMTPMEAYEKGYNKAMAQLADMTEECKQMGRQEVVEWVEENGDEDELECADTMPLKVFAVELSRWQAQVKEWGIKNGN